MRTFSNGSGTRPTRPVPGTGVPRYHNRQRAVGVILALNVSGRYLCLAYVGSETVFLDSQETLSGLNPVHDLLRGLCHHVTPVNVQVHTQGHECVIGDRVAKVLVM
jgi:hypothetical protein